MSYWQRFLHRLRGKSEARAAAQAPDAGAGRFGSQQVEPQRAIAGQPETVDAAADELSCVARDRVSIGAAAAKSEAAPSCEMFDPDTVLGETPLADLIGKAEASEDLRAVALSSGVFQMSVLDYLADDAIDKRFAQVRGMGTKQRLELANLVNTHVSWLHGEHRKLSVGPGSREPEAVPECGVETSRPHQASEPMKTEAAKLGSKERYRSAAVLVATSVEDLVLDSSASNGLKAVAGRSMLFRGSVASFLAGDVPEERFSRELALDRSSIAELHRLANDLARRVLGTEAVASVPPGSGPEPVLQQTSLEELVRASSCSEELARSASLHALFETTSVAEFLAGHPPRARFLGLNGFGSSMYRELCDLASSFAAGAAVTGMREATADPDDSPTAESVATDDNPMVEASEPGIPDGGMWTAPGGTGYQAPQPDENPAPERSVRATASEDPHGASTAGVTSGVPPLDRRLLEAVTLAQVVRGMGGSVRLANCMARTDLFEMPVARFEAGPQQEAQFLGVPSLGRASYTELVSLVDRYKRGVEAGEPPLRLASNPVSRPRALGDDAQRVTDRVSSVTLAELIRASQTSTRLSNMLYRTDLFDRRTVSDLLGGTLREAELLSLPELGRTTMRELCILAERYVDELWKGRDIVAVEVDELDACSSGGDATQVDGTVADLADSGLPVRIANRLAISPELRDFPLWRLVADPEGSARTLGAIGGLGRKSIEELISLAKGHAAQVLAATPTSEVGEPVPDLVEATPRQIIAEAFGSLSEKHRFVLTERYGLDGAPPRTLDEVGKKVFVTRERVRQVQKKALALLGRRLPRRAFERLLAEEQSAAWSAISRGDTFVPSGEIAGRSRSLEPLVGLAVDVVHAGLSNWLNAFAVAAPGGWLPPGYSSAALGEDVSALRRALERLPLPRPLADLAQDAGLELANAETAMALVDGYRVHDGYVHKGFIGAKARRIARMHRLALPATAGNIIDAWRLAELDASAEHDDERSARAVQTQLSEAPHLFAPLFDQYWVVLPTGQEWRVSPDALPSPCGAVLGTGFEPDSLSAWLYDTLLREGPTRHVDLAERAAAEKPGISASSVGPILLMHPCFHRVAPGVFDVRRARRREDVPDALLTPRQARTYAQARRCGEPREYFSCWGAAFEWRLCEWARAGADTEVFRSLLAVSDPSTWPAAESVRAEWRRLQVLHGRWSLPVDRRVALGADPPSPADFAAGVFHLAAFGSIGWIGAGRVRQARLGSHGAADLLALLVVCGAADAPADWQGPHRATAYACSLADQLGQALFVRGSLSWSDEPLSGLLDQAAVNRELVTWAEPAGVSNLIERLRSGILRGDRLSAPKPAALAGVEELFDSDEWSQLFTDE